MFAIANFLRYYIFVRAFGDGMRGREFLRRRTVKQLFSPVIRQFCRIKKYSQTTHRVVKNGYTRLHPKCRGRHISEVFCTRLNSSFTITRVKTGIEIPAGKIRATDSPALIYIKNITFN